MHPSKIPLYERNVVKSISFVESGTEDMCVHFKAEPDVLYKSLPDKVHKFKQCPSRHRYFDLLAFACDCYLSARSVLLFSRGHGETYAKILVIGSLAEEGAKFLESKRKSR